MKLNNGKRRGFTLVELLVVIGIIIVLVVVAIIFLNPSQLASQGRDSNRVSDITTINQNVALYHETVPAGSLGSSTILYISIPDPSATSTAGDQCQGLGITPLSGYTYHCAASSTYRKTDGTGWIPVNFSAAAGNQLSVLPVDPVNTTSSNEYYAYTANGAQYEVVANPEAAKTIANSTSSFSQGSNPGLALFPTSGGTGIVSYTTSTPIIGGWPQSVVFDSHTNTIWGAANGFIQINDTTYATTTYASSWGPGALAFDSHTNTIWGTDRVHDTADVINDTSYTTSSYSIDPNPFGIVFDPHTNTVWTSSGNNDSVTEINDTTFAKATYSLTVGFSPYAIAFDSHTNTLWVANGYTTSTFTEAEINDTTHSITYHSFGSDRGSIAFDPHTNTVWTVNGTSGYLVQINDTTYATSSYSIGSSSGWDGLAFDPHTNSIWLGGGVLGGGNVIKINDTTYATTTYASPAVISFAPDTHTNAVWAANDYTGYLTQFIPNN